MNVFICTPRLYKDAEQRFTASGESIVTFTGAVDAGYGDNKTTSWVRFNLWGKRGTALLPYLKDKTQVAVSGELSNRKWTDKEGQERFSLEVRVAEITLVGGKPQDGGQQQERPVQEKPKPEADVPDADVPFN